MEKEFFRVFGELTVPIYLSVRAKSKPEALNSASQSINSRNIELIEGEIHTSDEKEHVLLATYSNVRWIEVLSKDDL